MTDSTKIAPALTRPAASPAIAEPATRSTVPKPCTFAYDTSLAFGQRSEQVQQKRVRIGPKLNGDKQHLMDHQRGYEVHVAG